MATKLRSVSSPRSGPDTWPSQPGGVRQQVPHRDVAARPLHRATLKSGRYLRTGALRSSLPCSTRRITAVAAKVFEIEAMGKTVCSVTGKRILDVGHAEAARGDHAVVDDADARRRARDTRASSLRRTRRAHRSGSGGACASGASLDSARDKRPGERHGRDENEEESHGGGIIIPACGFASLRRRRARCSSPRPRDAHEKFKIVGTVVKMHAEQIDVKAVDGATYEIDMYRLARSVTRQEPRRSRGPSSRPGVKVMVNALGHDMFDFEAVEVQLVD